MKKILSTYGIAYSILLTIVFGLLYVYPKLELHLLLNSWHTDLEDTFFKYDRPVSAFEHYGNVMLPLVQGVDMHHSNSFPSGHASTFFVFCTCCALILAYHYKHQHIENNRRKWILMNLLMLSLLVIAALGGYSRVYLSQHFLSDVCVGSIIGFVAPCMVFYFIRNKLKQLKKLNNHVAWH